MTITLTREEAQQVLDALEGSIDAQQWEIDDHITKYGEWYRPKRVEWMKQQLANTNNTIAALRARLAQPEPEPVAWADKYDIQREGHDFWVSRQQPAKNGAPLYTAPPQRDDAPAKAVEWQGLTDEEIRNEANHHVFDESFFNGAVWARGKIKEKNRG